MFILTGPVLYGALARGSPRSAFARARPHVAPPEAAQPDAARGAAPQAACCCTSWATASPRGAWEATWTASCSGAQRFLFSSAWAPAASLCQPAHAAARRRPLGGLAYIAHSGAPKGAPPRALRCVFCQSLSESRGALRAARDDALTRHARPRRGPGPRGRWAAHARPAGGGVGHSIRHRARVAEPRLDLVRPPAHNESCRYNRCNAAASKAHARWLYRFVAVLLRCATKMVHSDVCVLRLLAPGCAPLR